MFFNSNDYPKDKAYRNDKMNQAQRDHMAQQMSAPSFDFQSLRRFRIAIIAAVALVALMALPGIIRADNDLAEAGEDGLFAEEITAYRVGHYYYVSGQYEKAVKQYTIAVEGIPTAVFESSAAYQVIFWDMGDALLMAGQADEALASYQHFLTLMDDTASEEAVAFVQQLEAAITAGVVEMKPLG